MTLRGTCILSLSLCAALIPGKAHAQRVMEKLDRGLIAVPSGGGHHLSWRLWGTEPPGTGFNVYKGTVKLNDAPVTATTAWQDNTAGAGAYTVRAIAGGAEQAASASARVLTAAGSGAGYWPVPLQIPPAGTLGGSHTYAASDASAADLDGDGAYEIILKWEPSNSKDNSQSGVTGTTILDAYRLDGTRLWRINLGPNIRSGAHYTQFLAYDFDGNGKAEIMVKTADGTVDGLGAVIGSATASWANASGYVISGPEFLTVFDGLTGGALQTVNYDPPRGDVGSWGGAANFGVGGNGNNDNIGNRADRFLAGVAYLDGTLPSAVFCRGYYGKSWLVAWDWRNGQLSKRWAFNSARVDSARASGAALFSGQGAHSLSVADVDGDGKDEIIYGAMVVDHDGKGLYSTGLRHGDALHAGDFDPARAGLEVYMVHENEGSATSSPGSSLHNARTGQVYWSTAVGADVGRGLAAHVDSGRAGTQFWGAGNLRDVNGANIGGQPSSTNFAIWWDGDLQRELADGTNITKHGGGTLLSASGTASNNGSKATPALQADFWGDWREEYILRASDNASLRIYTSAAPASRRFYTLMHNPQYRLAVAWQNVGYNQPPWPDYYLGTGMTPPPPPDIVVAGDPVPVIWRRAAAAREGPGHSVVLDIRHAGPYTVRITDLNGAERLRQSGRGPVANRKIRIGTPGVFIVRVSTARGTSSRLVHVR